MDEIEKRDAFKIQIYRNEFRVENNNAGEAASTNE